MSEFEKLEKHENKFSIKPKAITLKRNAKQFNVAHFFLD